MTVPFVPKQNEKPDERIATALEYIAARLGHIEENSKKSAEALSKIVDSLKKK